MDKIIETRDALILERSFRIFKYLFMNESQPPFKLVLTPTDRCNLDCFFCPNYIARKQQRFKIEEELTDDDWLGIVDQGIKLGVRQWCILGGGEPLLRRNIILPILERIKKGYKVIDFELITNATLFTDEIIKGLVKICEEKVDMGHELATIQTTVSIHGGNKTYKEIAGLDLYEKSISNVNLLSELKKKVGLKHPIIQINIVLNKKNLNEIEDLISTFANLGVDQIALHPIHVYEETDNSIKNTILSSEEYNSVLQIANRLMPKFPNSRIDIISLTSYIQQTDSTFKDEMDTTIKASLADPKYLEYKFLNFRCFEPWYDLLVNPDGRVGRCAAFVTRKEPINIKNESLEKIWFGEFMNDIRENVKRNLPMEGCDPCALGSNIIILRKELKEFIDRYISHDISKLKDIENSLKVWALK